MASHFDKRYHKAEMSTPDSANPRGRTPAFRDLLMMLLLLAAAFYYLYPKTTISTSSENDSSPLENGGSPLKNDGSRWPRVKVPGSDFLALAEAFGEYEEYEEYEPFQPLKRYSLEYGKVACWQDGGVWIKQLTPVEMSSLGVDRFQDTDQAPKQVDEDVFCTRLRMYGASFWDLPPQWPETVHWCWSIDQCVGPSKNVSLEVGFPTSGGVWFLNTSQGWNWPKSVRLQNALTMDERCEVIKDLGGLFCEDTQLCPEMPAVLGQ